MSSAAQLSTSSSLPVESHTDSAPILCVGEALIDVVKPASGPETQHVGGSLLNVACGLARLGHPTQLAAWWAPDQAGKMIEAHLRAHQVGIVPGSNQAPQTSFAYAQLNPQGSASYTFDLSWDLPNLSVENIAHLQTGSIAATLEPGGTKVLDLVQKSAARTTVSYDPNIRPVLMRDQAQTKTRVEQILPHADLVKASDEDISWLYPELSIAQVAANWLEQGPSLVVITQGGQGAYAVCRTESKPLSVSPLPAKLADTVGAGDSFMAGLISGLFAQGLLGSAAAKQRLQRANWEALFPALERATFTSGITVTHAGAYAPRLAELPPATSA